MTHPAKRMEECPARREFSCGFIDVALGWRAPIDMKDCDGCWAAGGPGGVEAQNQRVDLKDRILTNCKANMARTPVRVALTVMLKHMAPDEAADAFLSQAPRLGEESALKAAALFSPALVDRTRSLFEQMTPEERLLALPAGQRWRQVRGSWEEAAHLVEQAERWGLRKKARYFARAMLDKFMGRRVTREVREVRNVSCTGRTLDGAKVAEACPSMKVGAKGGEFCGDCGCGERTLARLDDKLWIRSLSCPRRRRGFSNEGLSTGRAGEKGKVFGLRVLPSVPGEAAGVQRLRLRADGPDQGPEGPVLPGPG